jgi:excisionase family DNA binding protein
MKVFTTRQAAAELNYTSDAVIRRLIQDRKIHAEKLGHVWVIPEEEIGRMKRIRKQAKRKTS